MDPETIAAALDQAKRDFDYRVNESTCTCHGCIESIKALGKSHYELFGLFSSFVTGHKQAVDRLEAGVQVFTLGAGVIADRIAKLERAAGAGTDPT